MQVKRSTKKKNTLFKTKNKGNEGMKNCYSELVIFNTVDLEIKGLKLLLLGGIPATGDVLISAQGRSKHTET